MGCTSSKPKVTKPRKQASDKDCPASEDMSGQNLTAQFPALGSQQRLSVGSAGSGRNKVELKPGHSLMDWIRLGRSGKDLTSVGGKVMEVSQEELEKHNKQGDAWIALRGKVYNVTPYLDFHPGGIDELMRGAGKDATQLFDEIHKWVNAESMLEKCYVGKLKSAILMHRRVSDLRGSKNPSLLVANGPMAAPKLPPPKPVPDKSQPPRFDWFQSGKTVTIVTYTKWSGMSDHLVMIDKEERKLLLTMYIEDKVFQVHVELENDVSTVYDVRCPSSTGKVEVVFQKSKSDIQWPALGKFLEKHNSYVSYNSFSPFYRECRVEKVSPVTHDTKLFSISLPAGTRMCVPVGHHVHIRHNVSGTEIVRSYTVVIPSLDVDCEDTGGSPGNIIHLMIKIYPDGAVTPWIGTLKPGEKVDVSNMDGTFKLSQLQECSPLVMFAAGTGFTPMVRLMYEALVRDSNSSRQVKLMFFNKTENDILWKDQLSALANKYERFTVNHVLSAADDSWTGERGRISKEKMSEFIPKLEDGVRLLICACGPTPFTKAVVQYAEELGYPKDSIHAFLG